MAEDELEALRRDVRYLMDRTEMLDCIANQSRGHDRHDVELMTSVFAANASFLQSGMFQNQGCVKGTWDHGELSYTRPLKIDSAAARWGR